MWIGVTEILQIAIFIPCTGNLIITIQIQTFGITWTQPACTSCSYTSQIFFTLSIECIIAVYFCLIFKVTICAIKEVRIQWIPIHSCIPTSPIRICSFHLFQQTLCITNIKVGIVRKVFNLIAPSNSEFPTFYIQMTTIRFRRFTS